MSRSIAVVALSVLLLPAVTYSQEPVKSFDQINTRIKPGSTIWVTDVEGRTVQGRLAALDPGALVLDADGPRTFRTDQARASRSRP